MVWPGWVTMVMWLNLPTAISIPVLLSIDYAQAERDHEVQHMENIELHQGSTSEHCALFSPPCHLMQFTDRDHIDSPWVALHVISLATYTNIDPSQVYTKQKAGYVPLNALG